MELLKFYLESIFYLVEFPTASSICSQSGNITDLCNGVINFTLFYSLALVVATVLMAKDLSKALRFLLFAIISIVLVFFFADRILVKISNPATFGMEPFIICFYFWAFLISEALVACLLYYEKRARVIVPMIGISLVFIFMFALFGRGTYEQYLILTGSFGDGYDIDYFLNSDIAKIILMLFAFTLIQSLLALAYKWVKTGIVSPDIFFRSYPIFFVVTILSFTSLLSLPVGDFVNESDVAEAKEYIDELKKDVDKYYLENGEYPKFIEDYVKNMGDDNPWLLKRHEYFTMGIRGTYYFSRPQKYCFIFQNPSSDFSYYTMTSSRDWNKFSETSGFDNVYLTMCDEEQEDESTLFANHFGMPTPDDPLTNLEVEFNALEKVPESKEATTVLHERIIEKAKEEPEILEYYKDNIGGSQF